MAKNPGTGEPPCQAEGMCTLSWRTLNACLNKNTYAPDKCDAQLLKLYKCCWEMYKQTDARGESTACPMPKVVRRWLKSHGEDAN